MLDTAFYLVTSEIARRGGVIESRYRVSDGRFVLDNKDLSRIRLSADEYVTGLEGVEKISAHEAKTLIAKNGFKKGVGVVDNAQNKEDESAQNDADNEQEGHIEDQEIDAVEIPIESSAHVEEDSVSQADDTKENTEVQTLTIRRRNKK